VTNRKQVGEELKRIILEIDISKNQRSFSNQKIQNTLTKQRKLSKLLHHSHHVERFTRTSKSFDIFNILYRNSLWFKTHVSMCEVPKTEKPRYSVYLPQCYVLIEELEVPIESYFYSVDNPNNICEILDLPTEKDEEHANNYKETIEDNLFIKTEYEIEQKDRVINQNISENMKEKLF
jgi:hypothetical protein